jgi:hypothetical protein
MKSARPEREPAVCKWKAGSIPGKLLAAATFPSPFRIFGCCGFAEINIEWQYGAHQVALLRTGLAAGHGDSAVVQMARPADLDAAQPILRWGSYPNSQWLLQSIALPRRGITSAAMEHKARKWAAAWRHRTFMKFAPNGSTQSTYFFVTQRDSR